MTFVKIERGVDLRFVMWELSREWGWGCYNVIFRVREERRHQSINDITTKGESEAKIVCRLPGIKENEEYTYFLWEDCLSRTTSATSRNNR